MSFSKKSPLINNFRTGVLLHRICRFERHKAQKHMVYREIQAMGRCRKYFAKTTNCLPVQLFEKRRTKSFCTVII